MATDTKKRPREDEDTQGDNVPQPAASASADQGNDDEDDDEDDNDLGPVDDMPVSHEIVLKDHSKVRLYALNWDKC